MIVYLFGIFLALSLLGLDQWVKFYVVQHIPLGESRAFIPGFIELFRVHNYGAAWSAFSGMRWFLIILTGGILSGVIFLLIRRKIRHPLAVISSFLILSGGLGNIWDRLRLGYVIDMFNFQFMNYPVFNVADMCVVTGAVLGCIYCIFFYKPEQEDKTQKNQEQKNHKNHKEDVL